MTEAITAEDLKRLDFTPEQIARLEALRAVYPAIEFATSEEWRRLVFLKWRFARSDMREPANR
jgi:hypothetical protein